MRNLIIVAMILGLSPALMAAKLDCSNLNLNGVYESKIENGSGVRAVSFELLLKSLTPRVYNKISGSLVDGAFIQDATQMPGTISLGAGSASCVVEEQYGVEGAFRYLLLDNVSSDGVITVNYTDIYGRNTGESEVWLRLLK